MEIYIGTGECANCYQSFSALGSLMNYQKDVFIFREDSAVITEMTENFKIPPDTRFNYLTHSIGSKSYCKVYVAAVLKDSFPFSVLSYKINYLNQLSNYSYYKKVHFPKSLVLNKSRLDILVSGNAVNIYDYILGKSVYFKIPEIKDSVSQFSEFKGSQFGHRAFLKYGAIDTTFYLNTYSILKQMNMAEPRIERSYINDTSLNLILNLRYPTLNKHDANDTMIMSALFLFQMNLQNSKKQLRYLEGTLELNEKSGGIYLFNQNLPFYFRNSNVLFSLYNIKEDKRPSKLLSVWGLKSKERYAFIEYDSFTTSEKQEQEFKLNDKYFLINNKFYFNPTLSIIKEYQTNTHYELNGIVKDKEQSFCNDITFQNNIFRALVYTEKVLELYEYDYRLKRITQTKKIPVPEGCLINSVKFFDFNTILFLGSNLNAVYLIRPE